MVQESKLTPYPFTYPLRKHPRRHGPTGYKDYESYRPWLRDEFSFRCVFCLHREQWGLVTGLWDIDHLVPQSRNPELALEYDNLLYVCSTCNSTKSFQMLADPCDLTLGDCLQVNADGTITALNKQGSLLIEILRLDNEDYTRFRNLVIQTTNVLATHHWPTFVMWMSYPEDLPELGKLRPKGNSRPSGIHKSFFERRIRGELAEVY